MTEESDTIWKRWEEIDALLADVMELGAAERERVLRARSESDPELVGAVRSLLASTDIAGERLDQVPRSVWSALRRRYVDADRGRFGPQGSRSDRGSPSSSGPNAC